MRRALLALLLAPAQAAQVSVVEPRGEGRDTAPVARALGVVIDEALRDAPRFDRLGNHLLADELVLGFGCAELEPDCVGRAAQAAGADFGIFARVIRRGDALEVRLDLVRAGEHRSARRLLRFIRFLPPTGEAAAARPGLRYLVDALLDGRHTAGSEVFALAPGIALDEARLEPLVPRPVEPGTYALTGYSRQRIGPDELLVVQQAGQLPPPAPSRLAGWLVTGVGAAALGAAAYTGVRVAQLEADYEAATDGRALQDAEASGERHALATNVLVGVGVATLGLGLYLLLD